MNIDPDIRHQRLHYISGTICDLDTAITAEKMSIHLRMTPATVTTGIHKDSPMILL